MLVLLPLVALRLRLSCLLEIFLVSQGKLVLLINCPLRILYAASHRFKIITYLSLGIFYISSLISSMILWLFGSILSTCHMFVFFAVFSCCCYSVAESHLTLCNPWTAACQASLFLTISQSLPKFTSIASVMPSAISSSDSLFSFYPQSFPASGTFPMSQLFIF